MIAMPDQSGMADILGQLRKLVVFLLDSDPHFYPQFVHALHFQRMPPILDVFPIEHELVLLRCQAIFQLFFDLGLKLRQGTGLGMFLHGGDGILDVEPLPYPLKPIIDGGADR